MLSYDIFGLILVVGLLFSLPYSKAHLCCRNGCSVHSTDGPGYSALEDEVW